MPLKTVTINEHGAARLRAGHPWVYRSDVLGKEDHGALAALQGVRPGTAVRLEDRRGRALGVADFSPHSQICLRLLSRDPAARIDDTFLREQMQRALQWRRHWIRNTDAYRLIWGEADGLPGLVVDRYGDKLVLQTLTPAMEARLPVLQELLREMVQPSAIVERNDARVRTLELLELRSRLVHGTEAIAEVQIDGIAYRLDLLAGQKTGAFLDQRENWAAVPRFLPVMPGGERPRVLDVFTYQGGFALQLARAGAYVEAVDLSRAALELADSNAQRNGLEVNWIEANAFDLLREYDQQGRSFDLIVLDPPAFAKSRGALESAERGYKEINLRALKMLRPGGVLVTCSCSHHLSEARLLAILAEAALDAHRTVTILERRGQSLDHPVLLTVPETHYLKCILARIE